MPALIGRDADFGGGFVRLAFNGPGGERIKAGTRLSAEEIRAMKNHRSLIRSEHIAVFPPGGDAATLPAERHVVHLGRGQYNVIAGRKLNDEPLSKEDADALAARDD